MLDIMRKHATSWMIKVILGAIIISFAFFFGYSRFSSTNKTAAKGDIVARVNGQPITGEQFQFFYSQNLDRLKQAFSDQQELNENMRNFAESMTLQQMIRRNFMLRAAKQVGVKIADDELAAEIRKNIEAINDGKFDPIFYKHQYLPFYQNRFGINYEELLREDMSIAFLDNLFMNLPSTKIEVRNSKKIPQWTFKVITIPVDNKSTPKTAEDVKKNILENHGLDPEQRASAFINAPIKKWEELTKLYNANIKKVGPIALNERNKIIQAAATLKDFKAIFTLTNNNPVITKPIRHGDRIFIVGLIERQEVSKKEDKSAKEANADFLNLWLQHELSEAEVETFL